MHQSSVVSHHMHRCSLHCMLGARLLATACSFFGTLPFYSAFQCPGCRRQIRDGSSCRSVIPYVHCVLYCLASREYARACCVHRALPFYISREARTWPLGPRQVGPIDVALNNILFIHYGIAGEGYRIPGFSCLLLGILRPAYPCAVLSKRRQA